VRLGICCAVRRPGFEFVNGTTSSFRDHSRSRRWTLQTRQSQTRCHVPISDGSGGRDSDALRTSALVDEEEYGTVLQDARPCPQEDSTHVDKHFTNGAGSTFTYRAHEGVPPTGISASILSPSDSTNISTPLQQSDVIDASVSVLEAWFSSFVDLSVPAPNTLVHDPLSDLETHEADIGDKFYELQEKLYICYWRNHLLKMLPDPFAHVEGLIAGCPALRPAIIALSACDLAQAQTEVRSRTIEFGKEWFYAPSMEHQKYGRMYYKTAKRELAEMDYRRQDEVSVLATLLLFVLIESRLGSFRGAAFHHHGIEHLLSSNHGICDRHKAGRGLIRVWIALRAQNWSCRIPFTLFDFQRSLLEIGVDVDWTFESPETRAEAVIVNMLQSWRLSLMILFERYAGRGDMESISSRCCRDVYKRMQRSAMTPVWTPKVPIPDENYDSLLGDQHRKLDEWHAALPQSHLPIESFKYRSDAWQLSQFNHSNVSGSCLQFQSHEAAMNYAYYVVARIFQSDEALDEFLSMAPLTDSPRRRDSKINHWLLILLRIVAGLDIMTYARRNFYAVGLLDVVKMCYLRLPQCNTILCGLADHLVEEFTNHCITYDGSVLISNFKHELQEIEEQRAQARDLFYIMPRFSPDAKMQPDYSHASLASTMAYGRDRATGKLFCGTFPSGREPP
jgi:hypothetical protein